MEDDSPRLSMSEGDRLEPASTTRVARRNAKGKTAASLPVFPVADEMFAGLLESYPEAARMLRHPAPLRKGKWSQQENALACAVISHFEEGLVPLSGVGDDTLRGLLSYMLHSDGMRVTKKYAGELSIRKNQYVHLSKIAKVNRKSPRSLEAAARRRELAEAFLASLEARSLSSSSSTRSRRAAAVSPSHLTASKARSTPKRRRPEPPKPTKAAKGASKTDSPMAITLVNASMDAVMQGLRAPVYDPIPGLYPPHSMAGGGIMHSSVAGIAPPPLPSSSLPHQSFPYPGHSMPPSSLPAVHSHPPTVVHADGIESTASPSNTAPSRLSTYDGPAGLTAFSAVDSDVHLPPHIFPTVQTMPKQVHPPTPAATSSVSLPSSTSYAHTAAAFMPPPAAIVSVLPHHHPMAYAPGGFLPSHAAPFPSPSLPFQYAFAGGQAPMYDGGAPSAPHLHSGQHGGAPLLPWHHYQHQHQLQQQLQHQQQQQYQHQAMLMQAAPPSSAPSPLSVRQTPGASPADTSDRLNALMSVATEQLSS